MNCCTRVQVDGVVSGITRRLVYYPACDSCAGKLTVLQEDKAEWNTYWCRRCNDAVEEEDVNYRYCLVLTVSDKASVANVTAFGNGWDKLFGATATNLHNVLKKFCVQKSYETVNRCFHDSIISAFVGCKFNFKFNVNLTRTIPRGSLSFKTLSNSITHHGHNNLIATNFSMMEVEQFKTVLNILEAKLLFSELPTDANPIVPKPKVTLHHDNNSYLYGSWISDTVSQEMCLFSLNDHSDCRPSTQGSLVDSVYWKWEPTLTSKLDEDIISDVVYHLELSKNEFWGITCDNDTTVTASHFVDSDYLGEDYSASFIDQIFSTENNRKIDNDDSMVVLRATNLTCDQATTTPSTNYSPDLFRKHSRSEVAQHKVSTPDSLPLSSLAKRGPDLFAEDSLSSPHLFGEANTPLSKMNNTTDFTSPALC